MSGALFDFEHYKELFETMELKEALHILNLAESGIPSFESDLAIEDFKDALAVAVKDGKISFRSIDDLAGIAVSDIELLSRIFFPDRH